MHLKKNKKRFGTSISRTLYTSLISSSVRTRRKSFLQIKNNLDFPDLCLASDFIEKHIRAEFTELMFGNPLPKNYSQLGNSDFSYVGDDFLREINWTLLSFRKYFAEIARYLELKEIFERQFILGNYYEAERIVSKIENEICFSLWTLESRFLLKEFTNGAAENKELLSDFNNTNESISYTKSLAHYLSLRVEKSLSVNRFNADLESALNKIGGKYSQQHKEYYLFKLSFLNNTKFKHHKELLAYDFQHSVIDRYLNFRKLLFTLLTTSNDWSESEAYSLRAYLINRINYLLKKINDPLLYKLKLFAGDIQNQTINEKGNEEDIEILDSFTRGEFEIAERRLRKALDNRPMQFDLYELYVRTLVMQRKTFFSIGNGKSLQNEILNSLYQIISYSSSYTEASVELLRIANNITNSELSFGIVDFIMLQTQGKSERRILSRLSYSTVNPNIQDVFIKSATKFEYLTLLKGLFPTSVCIDLNFRIFEDPLQLFDFESELPELSYKLAIANMHQKAGAFEIAVPIWEYILSNYQDTVPAYEQALIKLFECYEFLKRYDDAIKLFVDSFYLNPLIISKVDVNSIFKAISDSRFKNVTATVYLPIFYTICNADENETHTAFEKFNFSLGVLKPSEILEKFSPEESEKLFFYLKFTCGPEILKHSIHIRGSKERLEERLKISQYLREKDTLDKNFYDDEIKYISNILVIQKGLMELDESKIYVNEQGIITSELKEYDAVYQRFKAIGKVAQKSDFWMLDSNGRLTTVNYTEETVESSGREYSSNPVYDVYRELFDAIKEKFLYSKFGIVAYLSTRIRHGVLLGEIRPIFENHKLITLREGDTANYRRNYYWDQVYKNISDADLDKIQYYLKMFSYSVDGLIFDLIKKYLQVYNEDKNPDGWFNYDFTSKQLFWFALRSLKTRDFSQFAQQVFEILWERTDTNLNLIREKIQIETSNQFNELFDELEMNISNVLPDNNSQSIISAIKTCSTETHTTVTRISRWFKRSGTTASDFRLRDLIDIVMEYTNKSKSNKVIELDMDIQFSKKLKGEYLTHFADLFRIFTENILKHAGDQIAKIPAKIIASLVGENELNISIQNDVTDKEKLQALKKVWRDEVINVNKLVSEDKSGYHKALKIIKSDLKCENNYLETELSQSDDKFMVSMFLDITDLLA